jgi:hypothetical protein
MQRDHERGAGLERAHPGEEARGGGGVEAFGGLVEQQHVGVPEQALGDAEAASLSARERFAAGADGCVQSGREGGHGVIERGRGERLPLLAFVGGGRRQSQVVADGAVEDVRVLGDQGDALGQGVASIPIRRRRRGRWRRGTPNWSRR